MTGSEHLQNCSSCGAFLVYSGQCLSKVVQGREGTVVNGRQSHRRPRLTDACGEQRLARMVRSNRWATVAQISEEVNVGSDRKVSEHTVHRSLLRMGMHNRRPVRVPMLTPVHRREHQQWTCEHQNWTTEQRKRWPGLMNHIFFYITWMARCVCVAYLGDTWYQDAPSEEGKPAEAVWCLGKCSAAIHVDVTPSCTNYLRTAAGHAHPFMETLFLDGCGLFQQDNAKCHKAKMVQEWF